MLGEISSSGGGDGAAAVVSFWSNKPAVSSDASAGCSSSDRRAARLRPWRFGWWGRAASHDVNVCPSWMGAVSGSETCFMITVGLLFFWRWVVYVRAR